MPQSTPPPNVRPRRRRDPTAWTLVAAALLVPGLLILVWFGGLERTEPAPLEAPSPPVPPPVVEAQLSPVPTPEPDPMDAWIAEPYPIADGFDFPVGDPAGSGSYVDPSTGVEHQGWYVATTFGEVYSLGIHPGEDWNGRGGGDTDRSQPVHAVGAGLVRHAGWYGQPWGGVVVVEHTFFENHERRTITSAYVHLERVDVMVDEVVTRRQVLGTIGKDPDETFAAHLHFELRQDPGIGATFWPSDHGWDLDDVAGAYLPPTAFIEGHGHLLVPQREERLLLVHADSYRLRHYEAGVLLGEYQVGFGQALGRKRRRGDNRTPLGVYFVGDKHRGEFGGEWGAFYGGHWIKFSYPNGYDAAWGLEQGLVTAAQARRIGREWAARRLPAQDTALGSGIGFHGWIEEWDDDGPRHLSWGCVVMHNRDIAALYDTIEAGTMVALF